MSISIENYIKRFWNNVTKTDYCWIWHGVKDPDGYGRTRYKFDSGKPIGRAHRVSAFLDGRDPRGKFVCHTCDNPSCVNPAHLFIGTVQDNNLDKLKKGRQSCLKGSKNNRAKMTEELVIQIRNDPRNYKIIAQELGFHEETIRLAKIGQTWRHI